MTVCIESNCHYWHALWGWSYYSLTHTRSTREDGSLRATAKSHPNCIANQILFSDDSSDFQWFKKKNITLIKLIILRSISYNALVLSCCKFRAPLFLHDRALYLAALISPTRSNKHELYFQSPKSGIQSREMIMISTTFVFSCNMAIKTIEVVKPYCDWKTNKQKKKGSFLQEFSK